MSQAKVLVAIAVLAAFLAGSVFAGYVAPRLNSPVATLPAQAQLVAQQPAPRPVVVERRYTTARRKRSWEREVLIVAGSAGAGTAIGAVAGGKKGAAIGAVSGGIAGLVYDLATRNRR